MRAYEDVEGVFGRVFEGLLLPQVQVFKSLAASDVEDQHDCMRVPIEGLNQRVEGLLPSRIPKLQFDTDVAIDLHTLRVILHSQRNRVILHELVGQIPLDEATFAASGISNHYYLKHQVVVLMCH